MKTCETCGDEIDTKDGDNHCERCERKALSRKRANANRRARHAALTSIGMVRVRGALGGTYYE